MQGSCSLTSSPIARERKVHHYPVLCATYLVRKPLWREGTTPPDEKKLSQDDGSAPKTGRWLRGVRGSLASCGVFGMWFQSLAVHRAAVCSKEPRVSPEPGMILALQIWDCEWSATLMEEVTVGSTRETPAALLDTEVFLLLERERELWWGSGEW